MSGTSEAPVFLKKRSAPKKTTKSRLSFITDDSEAAESTQQVFRPKKSVVPRTQISQRIPPSVVDGPSERESIYTSDYLDELKRSMPKAPEKHDIEEYEEDAALDAMIADTYDHVYENGSSRVNEATIIPNESKIRYLKEQRDVRRRAGENYIPLSEALTHRDLGVSESRLQTEDQVDMLGGDGTEGLEGFEGDTLPLGSRNQARADHDRRMEMDELIQGHDSESSDSDDEWERTQVGKSGAPQERPVKTRTSGMPELVPIPTVEQVMQKIQAQHDAAKALVASKLAELEDIERHQVAIAKQEEAIRTSLQSASLAFETAELKLNATDAVDR